MSENNATAKNQDKTSSQGDGRRPQIVEGILLPPKPGGEVSSMAAHIPLLRQMKLRDDDLFLCTYPKTGTHWLWEVLSMLRQGKADYDKRAKVQLMMEFVDVKQLDEQPSPRILNTHLPFSMLPVQEMKARRTKVVHVYRNVKDVIVSMHFMAKSGQFPLIGDLNLQDFAERHLAGQVPYGAYFDYLKQVADFSEANPEVPVFSVAYEDIKKDPVSNIRRLAEFLEVPASDQLCQDIAHACSFQKMKDFEKEKAKVNLGGGDTQSLTPQNETEAERSGFSFRQKPVIYRKGEVGDWKNYFTVAMDEKVDTIVTERMTELPFTFQFT